jgi:hypothetical protein
MGTFKIGIFWTDVAMDYLHSMSDGMISVECPHVDFNLYMQI